MSGVDPAPAIPAGAKPEGPSRLILVPTPIGNLDDITLRALDALRAADAVAAEDTRRSRNLLLHHGIDRPLERLDAHTVAARAAPLLRRHRRVAYVTDAGTPGISDPGAELVEVALALGHEVEALPGATAFVPALIVSGLPTARFTFEGFLPRRGGARDARIAAVAAADATSLIYESPRRLAATLRDLAAGCGDARRASVSRELTKRFETTYRGTLRELADRFAGETVRGEIVIVVAPRPEPEAEPDFRTEARVLAEAGVRGRDLRDALRELGAPRNLAYELALDAERDPDADA